MSTLNDYMEKTIIPEPFHK